MRLTAAKLAQAVELVKAAGVDVWLTFVRETAEGGDPVLPLILEGGLTWHSALMVSASGRKVAIVGNYDADPLVQSGDWDEVVPYVQGITEPLLRELETMCGAKPKIAVNYSLDDVKSDGLSHGMYLQLEQMFAGTRFEGSLVSAEPIVSRLRGVKTPVEIERMVRAIEETDRLFEFIETIARPGITERQIYDAVQQRIDALGYGYAWDRAGDPIVNCGPDSVVGHGVPSATLALAPGHLLHVDLGVIVDGYASDLQRCWYLGDAVPDSLRHACDAVVGAIRAGFEALKPGVAGWTVDAAARSYLTAQGYPEYLHALGHQVGRVAHDGGTLLGPRWERYGKTPFQLIEPNQVYTLELGVAVEGIGYVSLEEMVQVTETGCRWLSTPQTEIRLLGAPTP